MDSQFGLVSLWAQGDWVTRSVVNVLLLMSLASWTVIAVKSLDILRIKRLSARAESFWHSSGFAEGLSNLGTARDNPFRILAQEGRDATAHHRNTRAQLHDALDISDWVMQHATNIDLPRAGNQQFDTRAGTIGVTVDADGTYFWNDEAIADAQLAPRLAAAATQQPQPELHIRGHRLVRYERVAQPMATAQRSGIRTIGFITEPERR